MPNHTEQVLELVLAVLASRATDPERADFRPSVERHGPEGSSEIAIYFYRQGNVVDVLEFLVTRNEVPVASVGEIEVWLRDAITDVLTQVTT